MARYRRVRPVPASRLEPSPADTVDADRQLWPEQAQELARALHGQLQISDRQWHALKGQPQRRAAEQLAAALVVLLDPSNPPGAAQPGPLRVQATELVGHALGWLKGELRDPGCPSHGR
ncbi:MAG: DUF6439 family protein [Cyanobium sp.]